MNEVRAAIVGMGIGKANGRGIAQDITVDLPKGPSVWDRIADHFIECILDGEECEAPLRHGLIVQEMMEGLLRSAKTGREIRF